MDSSTSTFTSGLGAVFCQDQGDRAGAHMLAYASRSLKPSEKNYSPYKLEFLAMDWVITNKLAYYLTGNWEFTLIMDQNPLTYVLTKTDVDDTGHRWLYKFDIKYKPGIANTDADALSRLHEETITVDTMQATCHGLCDITEEWEGYAHCMFVELAPTTVFNMKMSASASPGNTDSLDWSKEQQKDSTLERLIQIVDRKVKVNEKSETPTM